MLNSFLILFGKLVLFASRTLNFGSGSTWPGHIAMETNANFVRDVLKKNPELKIVLIAGTNGKTTTSLMLMKILEQSGLKVFRNEAGANLLNGIASSIIKKSNLTGRLNFDIAIFEVDENNLGEAIKQLIVHSSQLSVVLLNLFRDQLDRYGEVNTVAAKWEDALKKLKDNTLVFTNGDDPKLSYIAQKSELEAYYFGIDHKSSVISNKLGYDVDFTYCPQCQTKLKYEKVSYSHLGKFVCPKCGFTNPETETFPSLLHPLIGKYNIYNQNAAALVAQKAFDISEKVIRTALVDFKPAFGRQEVIKYKGRDVLILLSKNPAGFNQSIDAVRTLDKKGNILFALNDRIPDGRDVSWIWDVDFEVIAELRGKVFISGDRVYDMALRLKYGGFDLVYTQIHAELKDAIEAAMEETEKGETLFVLPTYSAMLEVRKILTGKKIL